MEAVALPPREGAETPFVPPRVLLTDLQFEEEGDSPMPDDDGVGYSPPNTRRAVSAGGSSSTSTTEIPAPPVPPPSAAAAAAAAAGDDCGECVNCKDKPKFGGPGIKRKGCLARRDTKALRPSSLSAAVVGTPPVPLPAAGATPAREPPSPGRIVELASEEREAAAEEEAAPAPAPPSAAPADPSDDCGVCVNCQDKPKFGGRGIKRKGCLRKKEVAEATRGVAHPSHSAKQDLELDAPASRSTDGPRASCETPATVDAITALAGPPNSGASDDPRARLRAQARGEGKRAASGLSAGASSSNAAKSDDDSDAEEEGEGAQEIAYEAGEEGTPPAADYAAVHLKGEGLQDSPRAPLNELSANRSVPSTPMLKTPDLEVAAGGVSPLSEFANILEATPNLRMPVQSATPAGNDVSPLYQLADLLEKTPHLPEKQKEAEQAQRTSPPSDPEKLKEALLEGGLDSPKPRAVWEDTPGQLKNDLRQAISAAETLASPHQPMGPPPLPGSFAASAFNSKARKRKLDQELKGGDEVEAMFGGSRDGVEGMFDTLGVAEDGDGIRISELLAADSDLLSGVTKPKRSGGSRSKPKEKDKGKPQRCRCDRSGCLKRYCVCFAAGNLCAPDCKCKGCENDDATEERREKRLKAVEEMLKKKNNAFTSRVGPSGEGATEQLHQSGCNCKKSGCKKRYCECYQAGVRCHEKCKCYDCVNPAGANPLGRTLKNATQLNMGSSTETALVRHDSVESADFNMSQDSARAASPNASPSKAAALLAAANAAAQADHPSTISPLLSAAPAPAFTPDVAMEARGYRQDGAHATTGESSRPHAATGDSVRESDDDSESYAMRQRRGAESDATPADSTPYDATPDCAAPCALPERLTSFNLSTSTPDASVDANASTQQDMTTPQPAAGLAS